LALKTLWIEIADLKQHTEKMSVLGQDII